MTELACCLLIGIYMQDELSFDAYHANSNNLYRVTSEESISGRLITRASTHVPLAPTLSDEYADVQSATRVYPYSALVYRFSTFRRVRLRTRHVLKWTDAQLQEAINVQ